jgi:hypothetical protein
MWKPVVSGSNQGPLFKEMGIKWLPWYTTTIEFSLTPLNFCDLSALLMHVRCYNCFYQVASLYVVAVLLLDSLSLSCSWISTPLPLLSHPYTTHVPLWPHVHMHGTWNIFCSVETRVWKEIKLQSSVNITLFFQCQMINK